MKFGVSFSVAEAVATFSRHVATDELDQAARFIVEIENDEDRGPSFVFLMALMMCGAIGNHARLIGRDLGMRCDDPTCPVHGTVKWN